MDDRGETLITEVSPVPAHEAEPGMTGSRYLIVLSGGIPGAMLALEPGGNWVGRAADNAIQLAEATVSRHHALIQVDEEGAVQLVDLGTTNGTFVNGNRLAAKRPQALEDGDRVRFGSSYVLKFVRPAPCEEQFQREMFERTIRDSLTGLYNRAYFMEQVSPLARRAARQKLGLAVLMLDLDHFKRINDTYGHGVGDAVLREVANVLRQCTRSEDIVARFGGEEFVIALPSVSVARAAERAELIRRKLMSKRLRVSRDDVLEVTASVGVAFASADRPRSAHALISTADLRLYDAKENGRNRVVCLPTLDEISSEQFTTVEDEEPLPMTREIDAELDGHLLDFDSSQGIETKPG